MDWEFTDDVEVYRAHVWELLASRPAENTLALTVIENVRGGRRWSAEPMLFGWCGGDSVRGAVSMTPPFELLLAALPEGGRSGGDVDDLVAALRERGVLVPGVNGDTATAERFAAAWTAGAAGAATVPKTLRLYELDSLHAPTPGPMGSARRAVISDLAAVVSWWTSFQQETGSHTFDLEPMVRARIDDERVWLWVSESGDLVSMAGRNQAAGVARIGPVYTPPEHRRHGYGAAVTAACTRDALGRGATAVVLFTDLANPTSNAIYQEIGYRPIRDHSVIRFEPVDR